MENETPNRRRFFHRIVGLGLVGGIATLLFGREKTLIPPAQAADGDPLRIGQQNYNTGTNGTFLGTNTACPGFSVSNNNNHEPGIALRGITEYDFTPPHENPLAGIQGVANTGVGVQGESGIGWAMRGITNSAWNAQFKNRGTGTDKSTLIQFETGGGSPKTWNIGVGDSGNGLGLTSGQFYIERTGGGALMVIDAKMGIGVGTKTPARSIHLSGSNACFRMDRNQDSAAFILVRTSADFTIWKTFYVGVDATKADMGEFFIGDVGTNVSGPSAKRLRIFDNGDVWVQNLLTGDLKFSNGVKVTEEGDGLAFTNKEGNKIAVLDSEGNFRVKGKITEDPTL